METDQEATASSDRVEELERVVKEVGAELAAADEREAAAAAREEEAAQERQTLMAQHVAAIAEKNQRLEELSASVRNNLLCE